MSTEINVTPLELDDQIRQTRVLVVLPVPEQPGGWLKVATTLDFGVDAVLLTPASDWTPKCVDAVRRFWQSSDARSGLRGLLVDDDQPLANALTQELPVDMVVTYPLTRPRPRAASLHGCWFNGDELDEDFDMPGSVTVTETIQNPDHDFFLVSDDPGPIAQAMRTGWFGAASNKPWFAEVNGARQAKRAVAQGATRLAVTCGIPETTLEALGFKRRWQADLAKIHDLLRAGR